MKRLLGLLLALLLISGSALAVPEHTVDMSEMEPIEFTYFVMDPNFKAPYDDNTIAENLFEKTKARIKFVVPPAEGREKLNIMLASGEEMPDLIHLDNDAVIDKLIEAGKVLPLSDLLEEHGPIMLRNYGEKVGTMRREDGEIYTVPSWYRVGGIELFPETRNGLLVRTGFLEKNDWYQPKTYNDYYELLKKFKEEDGSMIPVSLALADEVTIGELLHIANAAQGNIGNGVVNILDDEIIYARIDPRNKELFRLLNKLYAEGLMDQEAPVLKTDLLKNKLSAGQVFSSMGEASRLIWDANRVFEDAENGERFEWFFPKEDESLADDDRTYARYTGSLAGGICISSDCKDPVRLLQLLNFLNTEEGFMTLNGNYDYEGKNDGTPDIDWYVDVNKTQPASVNGNEIYITDWLNEQLGSNVNVQEERGLWKYGGVTYINCNAPDFAYDWVAMEVDSSVWWTPTERKINEGFGRTGLEYFSDLAIISADITNIDGLIVPPESDEGVIFTRATDFFNKQVVKCIAVSPDQFDAMYDDMIAQIKNMGIDQWEAAFRKQYDARMVRWYGEN